jgi:ADP-heptose:LPS heptosyltransferase
LKELACLLSMATLFVGNNSGPMHIAASMGTPCVVVQGPTSLRWEIFWDDVPHEIIRASHLPCVPCGEIRCLNQEHPLACMKELPVKMVADHVIGLLGRLNSINRDEFI